MKCCTGTYRSSLIGLVVLFAVLFVQPAGTVAAETDPAPGEPQVWVVYPKDGQTVGAVDSTFILGGIAPCNHPEQWDLRINGFQVPVHRDGGFLAFLPIEPGEFVFTVEARTPGADEGSRQHRQKAGFAGAASDVMASCSVRVTVPEALKSYGTDTLRLRPEYSAPRGNVFLGEGERLSVWTQGTPGCRAWFSIPGVADSVPMAETDPRLQPYWGESVFGAGAVPDSFKIYGVYSGFYDVPSGVSADSVRLYYYLAPPDRGAVVAELVMPPYERTDSLLLGYLAMPATALAVDSSSYRVSLNSTNFPFTVRFTDSTQIVRYGPQKGYLAIHQPNGVEALAIGQIGDWYKLELAPGQYGWAHIESVEPQARGILPPHSYLRSIRTHGEADYVQVLFGLSGKHAFRVIEEDSRTIRVRLYGVTTDTDWIRYDFEDDYIELVTWSQASEHVYEVRLQLSRDIWGYDAYYRGSTFCLQLNKAPEKVWELEGKVIVVDPGHSGDPGAIGPTRYTEAEANLGIALALKHELEDDGATVILTRSDTSHVELYDRPAIAKQHGAHLFVSIHNNALPDGVNPFLNNGTSSYYYHPHSIGLARSIHRRMLEKTELPDHGLFHGNLAVIRPTEYPAVLVECAFMLIPEQEAALKTDRFRHNVAEAIKDGIKDFLKDYADANER